MSESKPRIISSAIGRRKRAIASVRLISGKNEITVNGKPVSLYFPGIQAKSRYETPLRTLELEKYDAIAKVHGGGPASQLEALVLGLSRALASIKPDYQVSLRTAGLMTRDSRERQRRQVGMGGKSRRRKQSPKR